MASGFSFGFEGEDIEAEDGEQGQMEVGGSEEGVSGVVEEEGLPRAKREDVGELLSSLPSKIAYTIQTITSPNGHTISLPRRELFDIRVQLMAEDDGSDPNLLAGLNDDSDIRTNVYEGGFKNWECSIDLVKFLLDRGPRKDLDDMERVDAVVELGAGTALPSLTLFHYALTHSLPLQLTISDFNSSVLHHLTLPNLLLLYTSLLPPFTSPFFSPDDPNPLHPESPSYAPTGYLSVTPELTAGFSQHLKSAGIELSLISGAWSTDTTSTATSGGSPSFTSLIPSTPSLRTVVLGSETIYSPSSLLSFTTTVAALLRRVRAGKAIVAAKKMYFGVGGGVEMFKEECSKDGLVAVEVDFEGLKEGGVVRSLLEVQVMGGGEVGGF